MNAWLGPIGFFIALVIFYWLGREAGRVEGIKVTVFSQYGRMIIVLGKEGANSLLSKMAKIPVEEAVASLKEIQHEHESTRQ